MLYPFLILIVWETLTLLLGSENNSISNIELPMHTTLIFKEQAKIKNTTDKIQKMKRKGNSSKSLFNTTYERIWYLCYKDNN
jgi:hypothetical protein